MDSLLLRPEEAAAELRLSRATLYQLLASGRLRSVAVGRARRIPREALHEFIERLADEQRRPSDSSAWHGHEDRDATGPPVAVTGCIPGSIVPRSGT